MLATSFGPVAAKPAATSPEAGGTLPNTTLYTNIPGEPSADVPGYPGVHFGPGTGTTHFDRIFGSPNGNWIFSADTDNPTTNDEVVLVNDVVQYFEGDPAPWTGGTENFGLTDTKLGINDAGEWVFATNTDGATTGDEYLLMVSAGGVYTVTAQEGTTMPQISGATWGSTLESAVIASDGTVGLVSDSIGGPPTTENEALVLGPALLAQEGVTIPAGQIGAEFWENFDVSDIFISADGSHWMAQGDLTGSTTSDDIAVVDGTVVIQEDVILPGSGYSNPVDGSGIVGVWMGPNGDWFARGNNDTTEQDWVYSNGSVVAESGAPIYTGATEVYSDTNYSDTFFLHVSDSFGNYVIGGVTDNPDPLLDGVLVLNNEVVVVRQSDPIDLDNNGMFDDDVYFDTFGNDDAFIDDAGNLYIVATVMDNTNTRIGQGVFSIDLSSVLGGGGNTDPTLTNVAATSPIDENDSSTLTGDLNDIDEDPLELVIDWADGTVMTYTYPSGTDAFTETHQYLDDDPTGTASDVYGVSLTLSDGAGGVVTDTADITVNNVAPDVGVTADNSFVTLGAPVSFTGAYTDVGTLDTHTVEWDFGDGVTASGTLTQTHTYTATGSYVVTLTITDDDTGIGMATVDVEVSDPTDVSLSSFSEGGTGSRLFLWLLPLLALLAMVPVIVARRRKYIG
ncbi:MAG: PKD domain-containing protein [Candidatus Promineifilaceae bacterium]